MKLHKKMFYAGIALLAIFMAVALLGMFGSLQKAFLVKDIFSGSSPLGVMAVFAILIFAGIYFLKAGGQIIKGAIR